jgi:NADPH-dependent glutamate synthase beta subunit-like oxidoreductase/coenzyme F420-reducing hydrogenase delta subunit
MCTGRVDLSFIVRAFAKGADGVIIGGCWPGECHYVTEGNYDALCNVHLCRQLLAGIGLEPERLRIEWIAASEGTRFAEVMSDFSRQMTQLGPLGRAAGLDAPTLQLRFDTLKRLLPYVKLVQRERLRPPTRKEDEINAFFASDEAAIVFDELIADKLLPATESRESSASPCQLACPIGTQAWRYVAHIERGEYEQAYVAIREANPFPSVCARVCDHRCEKSCRLAVSGEEPVAIRSLKRFITDTTDPGVYTPIRATVAKLQKVAIVGAGPAGLTAAHMLSLRGYKVTVFDANDKPGGMLRLGIPAYRLPREVIDREIAALLDENITLKMGIRLGSSIHRPGDGPAAARPGAERDASPSLAAAAHSHADASKQSGRDITVDGLFSDGFDAVFLALGSMKSLPLRIDGEQAQGVYPSLKFLSEFNLKGVSLAAGRVGVIGGGNSAIDAARIALRQEGVDQVTIIYRRTREEMPAYAEEIDAAIEEGAVLKPLLSPVSIQTSGGSLVGLTCQRNELGPPDSSGRRRPVPIAGSEHVLPLDTLIIAVGEKPAIDVLRPATAEAGSITMTEWGTVAADTRTLLTSRKGLFAGGDVVTGPNTVVDAIAAGKKAAVMIDRYLSGEDLRQPGAAARAGRYGDPAPARERSAGAGRAERLAVPHAIAVQRRAGFSEVEQAVTEDVARREAGRCLRCDLDADARGRSGCTTHGAGTAPTPAHVHVTVRNHGARDHT